MGETSRHTPGFPRQFTSRASLVSPAHRRQWKQRWQVRKRLRVPARGLYAYACAWAGRSTLPPPAERGPEIGKGQCPHPPHVRPCLSPRSSLSPARTGNSAPPVAGPSRGSAKIGPQARAAPLLPLTAPLASERSSAPPPPSPPPPPAPPLAARHRRQPPTPAHSRRLWLPTHPLARTTCRAQGPSVGTSRGVVDAAANQAWQGP